MQTICLTFKADVTEEAAWDIAEALEKAAMAKGYVSVNGYVEVDRANFLEFDPKADPVQSSAETLTPQPAGARPTTFGGDTPDGEFITLGGEDGRMG